MSTGHPTLAAMAPKTAASFTAIPIVDLALWSGPVAARRRLAEEVRQICHEVGFFSIVNHGVPDVFCTAYFAALERFFALPDERKATIDKRLSRHFRGWERVGAELTNNRTDYREQLDLSSEKRTLSRRRRACQRQAPS